MRDDAFEAMVRELRPTMLRTCVLLGHNRSESEDIVQEAFIKIYRNWRRVAAATDSNAYAFKVLLNCANDAGLAATRSSNIKTRQTRSVGRVEDVAERIVHENTVLLHVSKLPKIHQEVVILRFWVDLTEEQTATVLDISVGTVKSRMHRALHRLRSSADQASELELEKEC